MATTTTNKEAKLVIVNWNDLLIDASGDKSSTILHRQIEEAYGASGMGILAIRNVPNFVATKDRVLRFAHALATLPNEYLENELADPKVSLLASVVGRMQGALLQTCCYS
jgi:hypothetical protein